MSDSQKWFDKTCVPLNPTEVPELPNQRTRVVRLRDIEGLGCDLDAFRRSHCAGMETLYDYARAIDAPGLAYALFDREGQVRTLQHVGDARFRVNSLVVGRHSHVDSPTDATNLALRHTVVTQRGNEPSVLEVRDLRSAAGTRLLDGTRVVAAKIEAPCMLDLGDLFLALTATPVSTDRQGWTSKLLSSSYATLQLVSSPIGLRLERFVRVNGSAKAPFRIVESDELGPVELRLEEMIELTPTPEQVTRGFLLGRYGRCDWPARGDGQPSGLSRVHAMVFASQGRPYIVDTGSTNGIRHAQKGYVRYKHLELGDQLWLGRTVRLTCVEAKATEVRHDA
jgi:hypothetical protein